MFNKVAFWIFWLGFIGYASLLAPPNQPDTFELIKRLSIGDWENINPLIIALFYLMGVFPTIYACLMFIDGREQKIKAFPFAIASFAVGAFSILPYLALRRSPTDFFQGQKSLLIKILDSRITGVFLTIAAVGLLIFGLSQGDWGDFLEQWQTNRFIHVMSLDFCSLCLLFPVLLKDDLARRGIKKNSGIFWLISLVPLFGALGYLCLRPPLSDRTLEKSKATKNITYSSSSS
jgi:hypothetical protein